MSIRASHKRPIRVRAWRSAMGQRLASSRRPLRWPLSRPAINVRMGTAPAKSVLFRRSLVAIRSRDNRLWGDPRCRCARGSDAPAVENVDRSLVDVCPMWDVAPPRCKPQLENEPARLHRVAGVRRTSAPCCATVTALAPIAIVRACSAASRFRALRAPLRDLDVISARPSLGIYRSEADSDRRRTVMHITV
jgi:hypothetical protein